MTPLTILRGARELLAEPERWTQAPGGVLLSNGHGSLDAFAPDACAWCVFRAVEKAAGGIDASNPALGVLFRTIFGGRIGDMAKWNDAPERTHADILQALDRAIALATPWDGGGE